MVIDLQNVVREGREVTPDAVLQLYPELSGQEQEEIEKTNFANFMKESAQQFTAPMV